MYNKSIYAFIMVLKNRFQNINAEIANFINTHRLCAFTNKALYQELRVKRKEWNLYASDKGKKFVVYLLENKILSRKDFRDQDGRMKEIYHLPNSDTLSIYTGLKKNAYFTHFTAMYLNQLTLQIPKTHYLNFEHYPDTYKATLSQKLIDESFKKPQRKSNTFYSFKGNKIYLTNGKYTNRLGVISVKNKNTFYEYTNLERTLIDITIRPVYAGGVFEVLEAYKRAKNRIDVQKLKKYLLKLNYIYPYNQLIGFYLEKANYSESQVDIFKYEQIYNFYLTYNLKKPKFSEKWKIWYPIGF